MGRGGGRGGQRAGRVGRSQMGIHVMSVSVSVSESQPVPTSQAPRGLLRAGASRRPHSGQQGLVPARGSRAWGLSEPRSF